MRSFFRFVSTLILILDLAACAMPVGESPSETATSFPPTATLASDPKTYFLNNSPCDREGQLAALSENHTDDLRRAEVAACYKMYLNIDTTNLSYTGSMAFAYLNDSTTELSDLVFRLYPNTIYNYGGELFIDSVEIKDRPTRFAYLLPDQSAVRIDLPRSIPAGGVIQMLLFFHGRIPESTSTYGIFNYSAANDVLTLANWYPILAARDSNGWSIPEIQPQGDAVTSITALYHVSVELSADWEVAATGVQVIHETLANPPPRHEIEFVSGPVRDFMIVASPNFAVNELVTPHGIVRQWTLPGFEQQEIDSMEVVERSLKIYSQQFGDYPFTELDVVSIPLNNASGVEFPGLILIEHDLYDPTGDKSLLALVLAHEVAHQWWYNLVGNDVQQNPWQDEALATYASMLYLEEFDPAYLKGTLQYFENNVQKFDSSSRSAGFHISDPLAAFATEPQAYSIIVYQKGALFFWNLRQKIGAEAFNAALADYYRQNTYQLVDPAVLLAIFEEQCKCDLSGFYQDWGVTAE